ncbi:hypothetical protein [Streptomyces spiramenti]|uniref:DUF3499 family protein n=1 Tax=Streptomyces spiramenti TaxID=2720606 RepID=A0ABX1AP04_9ACTN|nr:hypothetical protein [Streptomyces spiramenti]NJP67861.1 hypothetical protein [Streptomyces spiramenti]
MAVICPPCVDAGRQPEGDLVVVGAVDQASGPGYTLWACQDHAAQYRAEARGMAPPKM